MAASGPLEWLLNTGPVLACVVAIVAVLVRVRRGPGRPGDPLAPVLTLLRSAVRNGSRGSSVRLQLVGAGPGDPMLLTLRAAAAIAAAEVLVVDRLVRDPVPSTAHIYPNPRTPGTLPHPCGPTHPSYGTKRHRRLSSSANTLNPSHRSPAHFALS